MQRFWSKQHFWSNVDKTGGPESCWLWLPEPKRPYGRVWLDAIRKEEGAHRVAWELVNGPIPSGLFVLHGCDVPRCVNPGHLSVGTQADNQRDMVLRGRAARGVRHGRSTQPQCSARGERNGAAKLTVHDVRAIRRMAQRGVSGRGLARLYGMNRWAIHSLLRGITWRHVVDEVGGGDAA